MRVTENTNFTTVRDSINRSKGRMEKSQEQASTLKKLNSPSDNPVAASKLLEIRTDKVNHEQFQVNAKLAETFLDHTDHALEELSEIVVRAKEIAIGQSSGASSNEQSRNGVAEEVGQLYLQAVSVANRRIGDRYLFSGYQTDKPAVNPEGKYEGDQGLLNIEVSRDVFIPMNLPGFEVFNTNPKAALPEKEYSPRKLASEEDGSATAGLKQNDNIFEELQGLRVALLTGDQSGIQDKLEKFDALHATLTSSRAKVGSRMRGLDSAVGSLERHGLTNAQLASGYEDADMATVMTDLAREETVLRGTLAGSKRLIQPTLMDFLK